MLDKNVMIGMEVVAHSKTAPGYIKYNGFMYGYEKLYVRFQSKKETRKVGKPVYVLNGEKNIMGGNYYVASDFEPINLIKPKHEIDLSDERDAIIPNGKAFGMREVFQGVQPNPFYGIGSVIND